MNNNELINAAKDEAARELYGCEYAQAIAKGELSSDNRGIDYFINRAMEIYAEMVNPEPKSVFIVNAYRWGDRERHSYTLGAFSNVQKAIECANSHTQYRGGKYSCMVEICAIDEFDNDKDDYTEGVYKTDCMGHEGFDNTKTTKP